MSDTAKAAPAETEESSGFDIQEILKILPHRYPFLLIDRVTELTRTKRIVAIKNVSVNEPYFVGPLSRRSDHAGGAGGRSHGASRWRAAAD